MMPSSACPLRLRSISRLHQARPFHSQTIKQVFLDQVRATLPPDAPLPGENQSTLIKYMRTRELVPPLPVKLPPDYHVRLSMVLQRNPLCITPLNEFEQEYEKYQQALQYDKAGGPVVLEQRNEGMRREMPPPSKDSEEAGTTTNHTDAGTGAGRASDTNLHNINRHPSRILYLLLKHKLTGQWHFPDLVYDGASHELVGVLAYHIVDMFSLLFLDSL